MDRTERVKLKKLDKQKADAKMILMNKSSSFLEPSMVSRLEMKAMLCEKATTPMAMVMEVVAIKLHQVGGWYIVNNNNPCYQKTNDTITTNNTIATKKCCTCVSMETPTTTTSTNTENTAQLSTNLAP